MSHERYNANHLSLSGIEPLLIGLNPLLSKGGRDPLGDPPPPGEGEEQWPGSHPGNPEPQESGESPTAPGDPPPPGEGAGIEPPDLWP